MLIKPTIRTNFFTNAHPLGIKKMIEEQISQVKSFKPFKGPQNVLILGGSSGYGLASRISLAYGANANTISVSFEREAKSNQSGSAGYWNNVFFDYEAKETKNIHKDFNGDAFSLEMKKQVLEYIKNNFKTIDLLVYSLASGVRKNELTNELVKSSIKPLGKTAYGKTIDIASNKIIDLNIEPGTTQETKDTVFVMGGSDWQDWINYLDENQVLAKNFKTISYTYIGGENTDNIYRKGTLGEAKLDLELKASQMNIMLKDKYDGEALISSSKAIVSKASVFIPQMPIYVSCLFQVMKSHNTHETTLEHKYRLFKDMIYGDKRIVDEKHRIRLDHLEMDEKVQTETMALMHDINDEKFFELEGTKSFLKEFYQINGFEVDGIDYDKDVDLDELIEIYVGKN